MTEYRVTRAVTHIVVLRETGSNGALGGIGSTALACELRRLSSRASDLSRIDTAAAYRAAIPRAMRSTFSR